MISLANFSVAFIFILFVQASAAFMHPAATKCVHHALYAKRGGQNCPGKTAFNSNNNISGIGGLNKASKSTAPKKNNITKGISKSTKSTGADATDWSKIFVAFLTPWRNPNSILLYLFIIVYVLGKIGENQQ